MVNSQLKPSPHHRQYDVKYWVAHFAVVVVVVLLRIHTTLLKEAKLSLCHNVNVSVRGVYDVLHHHLSIGCWWFFRKIIATRLCLSRALNAWQIAFYHILCAHTYTLRLNRIHYVFDKQIQNLFILVIYLNHKWKRERDRRVGEGERLLGLRAFVRNHIQALALEHELHFTWARLKYSYM